MIVNPDALEHDAVECFDSWSDKLDSFAATAPAVIPRQHYSLIPGSGEFSTAYADAAANLKSYIESGSKVFDQFATVLLSTVIEYMEANQFSIDEIKRVEGELAQL